MSISKKLTIEITQEEVMENILREVLRFIGEDPEREGLKETPSRVVKMWGEVFSGYGKDPKELLTTFDKEHYDEMVLLRDVEFFSMCEHHVLPFFGKAFIAYIPNKKVIGVSKLARLLEIYSRRLQIQERLTCQISKFLFEELESLGAACVLKAQHLCMQMRGVEKQHSVMVTSSLVGAFRELGVREEFLSLCKL